MIIGIEGGRGTTKGGGGGGGGREVHQRKKNCVEEVVAKIQRGMFPIFSKCSRSRKTLGSKPLLETWEIGEKGTGPNS